MPNDYENTSLWRASLGPRENDKFADQRNRLRVAYASFRNRAGTLVSRIQTHLPGLTQHDLTHLDSLWETASLVAGPDYDLNGLEGFVLGGAILLHDAALCFEAYDGGIAQVRATTSWTDAYSAECEYDDDRSDDERRSAADFAALRNLHARQAERLNDREWIHPATKESLYLINDDHLRTHLGQLTGLIASSHHWNIEEVGSRLRTQVNSPGELPREWQVDPIKIACLLRCADALHIDNVRAPDFLHALLKRQGVSFNHWQAQNWLGRASTDLSDPTGGTLLVTSTHAFSEDYVKSWWVAYDAVCLADKEIKSSNALLDSRDIEMSPSFAIKKIRGTESPEIMSSHIQATGWLPCSAELHVGNIERLVTTLGGEQLYTGQVDRLAIALRELIQNARDAVCARQALETDYTGEIRVQLVRNGETAIIVEDDGVGMSRRVLTGPLLDFGTSFWASTLVQSELPGLRTSGFHSVGKFGIGFYSVFMVANTVRIASRRWDEGLDSTHQLSFPDGITLRPLLVSGRLDGFTASTRVTLSLSDGVLTDDLAIEIKRNQLGSTNFHAPFPSYLAALVAGLDVNVIYVGPHGNRHDVHLAQPIQLDHQQAWLQTISFADHQTDSSLAAYISSNATRLRPIVEDGRPCGLAAVSTRHAGQDFLGMATVGGLAHDVHHRSGDNFIGYIDHLPRSARREQSDFAASDDVMSAWATEQLSILESQPLNPLEQCYAAYALCHLKTDPQSVARLMVTLDGQTLFLRFEELVGLLPDTEIAIFKSTLMKSALMDHAEIHHKVAQLPGYALIRPLRNGSFLNLEFSGGVPKNNYSIIDCLHRTILEAGMTPIWRTAAGVAQSAFGPMDAVIVGIQRSERRNTSL